MAKFSAEQVKTFFEVATVYFSKVYTNGVSFAQLKQDEEKALKDYLKVYCKNLDSGKNRYNSAVNKARNKWFALETIEKIMALNGLTFAQNLDFLVTDQQKQLDLFVQTVNQEAYESYLQEDDLNK